jgi:hypothetical protein
MIGSQQPAMAFCAQPGPDIARRARAVVEFRGASNRIGSGSFGQYGTAVIAQRQTYLGTSLQQNHNEGIVFCNLGTSKTVISKFVTTANIVTPYLSPYGYPNDVPVGQKSVEQTKKLVFNYLLIPWYDIP